MKKSLFLSLVIATVTITSAVSQTIPSGYDYYFFFQTLEDHYADGTPLADGECYALVWRDDDLANQVDGLFNPDGTPVSPDKCEILAVFPDAIQETYEGQTYAGSRAWTRQTDYVLKKGEGKSGVYSLFVFDTRQWNGSKWIVGGKTSDKSVAALRGYGLVENLEIVGMPTSGEGGEFFYWYTAIKGEFDESDASETEPSWGYYSQTSYRPVNASRAQVISFDANGGAGTPDPTMRESDSVFGELPQASRAGYAFDGWYDAAEGGERVTAETAVTSDTILYAHWSVNPIISAFSIAGGTATLSVTNTTSEFDYMISKANDLAKVHSTTNIVGEVKQGSGEKPLTWTIPVGAEKQGFFKVLPRKPDFSK